MKPPKLLATLVIITQLTKVYSGIIPTAPELKSKDSKPYAPAVAKEEEQLHFVDRKIETKSGSFTLIDQRKFNDDDEEEEEPQTSPPQLSAVEQVFESPKIEAESSPDAGKEKPYTSPIPKKIIVTEYNYTLGPAEPATPVIVNFKPGVRQPDYIKEETLTPTGTPEEASKLYPAETELKPDATTIDKVLAVYPAATPQKIIVTEYNYTLGPAEGPKPVSEIIPAKTSTVYPAPLALDFKLDVRELNTTQEESLSPYPPGTPEKVIVTEYNYTLAPAEAVTVKTKPYAPFEIIPTKTSNVYPAPEDVDFKLNLRKLVTIGEDTLSPYPAKVIVTEYNYTLGPAEGAKVYPAAVSEMTPVETVFPAPVKDFKPGVRQPEDIIEETLPDPEKIIVTEYNYTLGPAEAPKPTPAEPQKIEIDLPDRGDFTSEGKEPEIIEEEITTDPDEEFKPDDFEVDIRQFDMKPNSEKTSPNLLVFKPAPKESDYGANDFKPIPGLFEEITNFLKNMMERLMKSR